MPISTSATAAKLRAGQRGFTLLEVLVVVVLMAVLATVFISATLSNVRRNDTATAARELHNALQLMAERSLFTGELLALYLETHQAQPLVLNPVSLQFEPLPDPFYPLTFDDALVLEWEQEQADEGQRMLSAVGESLAQSSTLEKQPLPQVFFFPSGDTTSTRLLIRHTETGTESEIHLSSLGQVSRPSEQQP